MNFYIWHIYMAKANLLLDLQKYSKLMFLVTVCLLFGPLLYLKVLLFQQTFHFPSSDRC